MKRAEILKRLTYSVPANKIKRVIVCSDIAAEADDPFAIVHHLLTPTENVVGIVAGNFEWRYRTIPSLRGQAKQSMEKSYEAGKKLLQLMDIDDVPLYKGAVDYIEDKNNLPINEGSQFIIDEAMRESDEPLYIALQGSLTDLAVAYLLKPEIAERIEAAIWIGGGCYPNGGVESNLQQDVYAAQVLFDSPMKIWQVPVNTYSRMFVSFAELVQKVKPCGEIGKSLVEKMYEVNDWYGQAPRSITFPHGETWSIGDQPTVSVLLETSSAYGYHMEHSPKINDDMSYSADPDGKLIRVYDTIDNRMTMEDLFAKLYLCYGEK